MNGVLDLVREDLRDFAGYASARTQQLEGEVWLNANEAPLSNPGDADGRCRRYPSPQPPELQARLAELYGVDAGQLLLSDDDALLEKVRARRSRARRWRARVCCWWKRSTPRSTSATATRPNI